MYRRVLDREIENWESYASGLNERDKELFYQMLKSANNYSPSIEAKGESYATESLIMSLLLEFHKKLKHWQNLSQTVITNRDLLWIILTR